MLISWSVLYLGYAIGDVVVNLVISNTVASKASTVELFVPVRVEPRKLRGTVGTPCVRISSLFPRSL